MSVGLEHKYRILFLETLKISACTFGGGFVIVPLFRRKFVNELGVIGDEEMMDLIAISQSCPGPIAVNGAILVGYKIGGIRGGLTALLGTILPPLGIITVISFFYKAFCSNTVVKAIMAGMLCGVAAVVLDVTITMIQGILRKKKILPLIILIAAFLTNYFAGVNLLLIIFVCAIIGIVKTLSEKKNG